MAVLSDEQQMLKDMAVAWARDRAPVGAYRGVLDGDGGAGFDPAMYAEMAEMGWTGILVPAAQGGSDFGAVGLGLILEEAARSLVAAPLVGSAMAVTSALVLGGDEAQRTRWLPALAGGEAIGALAVDEGPRHDPAVVALAARRGGDGWRLSGTKRPVHDGMAATLFVVAAKAPEGIGLFVVPADAAGVTRHGLDQLDGRRPAVVEFADAPAEPLGDPANGMALLDAVLDRARVGLAAELLGMAEQAYVTTLDYLKTRQQFGQLIGAFQALQHRAAAMYGELMLARSAVEAALAGIDAGAADLASLASLAKATAGEAAKQVAREMVQMHGGIGMTHEHDAGLYMKRIWAAEATYGNAAWHRERWGRLNGF